MHLVAHKMTPGNWYYVELMDKSSGWNLLMTTDTVTSMDRQISMVM